MESRRSSNPRASKYPKSSLGDEDRISRLPDAVLHHILSFIDTELAVKTCILSQRWRNVWVSLPVLNFEFYQFYDHPVENPSEFINFIDEVFFHRDGSDIHKFSLIHEDDDEVEEESMLTERLYNWVLALVRRNIQELDLDVYTKYSFALPACLFTCETLTLLKLTLGRSDSYHPYTMPAYIALPRLRKLLLQWIHFSSDSIAPFSNCPVLETLSLSECGFLNRSHLDISIPSLKHLKLKNLKLYYGWEVDPFEICPLRLRTPSLKSLSLTGVMDIEYSIEGFPALCNAKMGYDGGASSYRCALHLIRFLQQVCNVKALVLSPLMIRAASRPVALKTLPTLKLMRLRSMHLHSWLSKGCIHAIIYLLGTSPQIETLILQLEVSADSVDDEGDLQVTGQRMLNHLKYVEIRGARGSMNELIFMEILLKNAAVLKKLVIFTSEELLPSDRKERVVTFSKKLLDFPRAASSNIAFLIL